MIDLLHEVSHFWVEYFGLIVIQNSLFIIVILLLLIYFPKISARIKYLVCIIGVIKLLIPPFVPYQLSPFYDGREDSTWITGNEMLVDIEQIFAQTVQILNIQGVWQKLLKWLSGHRRCVNQHRHLSLKKVNCLKGLNI